MLDYQAYYNKPKFRKNVKADVQPNSASFSYAETSFSIEFDQGKAEAVNNLLMGLKTGINFKEFQQRFPEFAGQADELFGTFDRYGFISEAQMPETVKALTGKQLWKIIDTYTTDFLQNATMPLGLQLWNSEATKSVILTYALQYYHFVKAGPTIIAAAYANADREPVRKLLEHFLVSELRHDELLLKALAGAGMNIEKVKRSVPLPETFALISAFHVMASQEPLSFYATVFLVEEERPAFNEALVRASKAVGLKKSFYDPILSHSHINEEEDHGGISLELLQHYSAISDESKIVALKQVHAVLESMIELEKAIIRDAEVCTCSIK